LLHVGDELDHANAKVPPVTGDLDGISNIAQVLPGIVHSKDTVDAKQGLLDLWRQQPVKCASAPCVLDPELEVRVAGGRRVRVLVKGHVGVANGPVVAHHKAPLVHVALFWDNIDVGTAHVAVEDLVLVQEADQGVHLGIELLEHGHRLQGAHLESAQVAHVLLVDDARHVLELLNEKLVIDNALVKGKHGIFLQKVLGCVLFHSVVEQRGALELVVTVPNGQELLEGKAVIVHPVDQLFIGRYGDSLLGITVRVVHGDEVHYDCADALLYFLKISIFRLYRPSHNKTQCLSMCSFCEKQCVALKYCSRCELARKSAMTRSTSSFVKRPSKMTSRASALRSTASSDTGF